MDWKKFFKPDRRKIVIFLVLFLLANIPYIGTYNKGEKTPCYCLLNLEPCYCSDDRPYVFELNPVFWPPFLRLFVMLDSSAITRMIPIANFHSPLSFDFSVPDGYSQFFGIVAYWYILSILIVWIYGKIRKK